MSKICLAEPLLKLSYYLNRENKCITCIIGNADGTKARKRLGGCRKYLCMYQNALLTEHSE